MEEIYFRVERSRKLIPFRNIHHAGTERTKNSMIVGIMELTYDKLLNFAMWELSCKELWQKITMGILS